MTCQACNSILASAEAATYGGVCELCWLSRQPITNKNPGVNRREREVRNNRPLRVSSRRGKKKIA